MRCEAPCLHSEEMETALSAHCGSPSPENPHSTTWQERLAAGNSRAAGEKQLLPIQVTVRGIFSVTRLQNNESGISLEWLSMESLCEYLSNFNTTVLQV